MSFTTKLFKGDAVNLGWLGAFGVALLIVVMDVIYSLPNQTLTSLSADIDQVLKLGVVP